MPGLFGRSGDRDERKKEGEERKAKRRQWRIDKINALKEKFYAVAAKRKWLVLMMGLGIIIYFIITSGGGMSIIDKVKGLFF